MYITYITYELSNSTNTIVVVRFRKHEQFIYKYQFKLYNECKIFYIKPASRKIQDKIALFDYYQLK